MTTLRAQPIPPMMRPPCGLRLIVAPVPYPERCVIERTETSEFTILRVEPHIDNRVLLDHAVEFMREHEIEQWVRAFGVYAPIHAFLERPWAYIPDPCPPVIPSSTPHSLRLPHCNYT